MKRLLIILGLGLTIGMANVNTVEAQIVNVYVNIDMQPAWGPAGYNYAAFYYFPALNIYYDVHNALFYYLSGNRWLVSYYLPIRYQRYDLYTLYKVVINDYHNPWIHYRTHRRLYASYRNVRTQMPIRAMTADRRYNIARTNTRSWVEQRPTTTTNRSTRSTATRATPNTQNRNTTATQNRSTTTATQNRNATTTTQNRNATTATQNRNSTSSRNSNATTGQDSNTTTRNNQNSVTTRSSRSESSNTSVNSNTRSNNNNNSSSTTRSSENTQSRRSERR